MATFTSQKKGGTGTDIINSSNGVATITGVLDIADGIAQEGAFAAGDQFELVTIPANATVLAFGAYNKTALVLGTTPTIDIGTTLADPDEFVDAQTTVTASTPLTTAATTLAASSTERTLVAELGNASGTVTSGKIAWTVTFTVPAVEAEETAKPRVYPNAT